STGLLTTRNQGSSNRISMGFESGIRVDKGVGGVSMLAAPKGSSNNGFEGIAKKNEKHRPRNQHLRMFVS
ncbi:MAG: hypothetical protein ACKN82_19660, partial [Pirellula sp.]